MKAATNSLSPFPRAAFWSVVVYSSVAASHAAQRTEETVAEDLASLGHTPSVAVLAALGSTKARAARSS